MKQPLISACIIVAKDEPFIDLTIKSLLGTVDEIIIVGDPNFETREKIRNALKLGFESKILYREFDGNYGEARTVAKENASGQWCLQIDADEILSDNGFLLRKIAMSKQSDIYHMKYEHFIWHFGLLDNTVNPHVGLGRFFKNKPEVTYPQSLHEFAVDSETPMNKIPFVNDVIIWHLGYTKGRDQIRYKYDMNMQKSAVHSKEFLNQWFISHMNGTYNVRHVSEKDRKNFPAVLKKYLGIL